MRMPADWELHIRSWIALPGSPELWQRRYHAARQTVIDFANQVIDFEPVNLICPRGYGHFMTSYTDKRIEIIETDIGENWLRDISPTYIETNSGQIRTVFSRAHRNLPGYPVIRNLLSTKIHLRSTTLPLTLENGTITTDGQGTAICTNHGMFRNRKYTVDDRETIERLLLRYFGLHRIIWLNRSLMTDQTDGHITNLVRFIAPGIVLLANHSNTKDPNKGTSMECYDQLSEYRDKNRTKLSVYQVHNPPPIIYKGHRLIASYTNFYIANNAVFIPSFYKPRYDRRAYILFQDLFPRHTIIQQPVLPLLTGGGGLYCPVCPQTAGSAQIHNILKHLESTETT